MGQETVYLCGKMRGIHRFNFPAFEHAAQHLRDHDYAVISPAEMDLKAGLDPYKLPDDWDWDTAPEGIEVEDVFRRDLDAVFRVDKLAVLEGWETSEGTTMEMVVANRLGKPAMDAYTFKPIDLSFLTTASLFSKDDGESILHEAHRLTNRDRQTDYGHPYDDFSRTAAMWSQILGVDVTPQQVALCMVCVKVSREINRPKRDNRVDIAGYINCLQMIQELVESESVLS